MADEKILRPWQKVVVDFIDKHEEFVETEDLQSLSDYDINHASCVTMSLPKYSGHTTMTAYIAANYPTVVIYKNMKHWTAP